MNIKELQFLIRYDACRVESLEKSRGYNLVKEKGTSLLLIRRNSNPSARAKIQRFYAY